MSAVTLGACLQLPEYAGRFNLIFSGSTLSIPQHILGYALGGGEKYAKIDKSENDDKVLTFHDSCNVARVAVWGPNPAVIQRFRKVIKAVCNNFVDMPTGALSWRSLLLWWWRWSVD
ncbi:MAG: hypothetical protein R3E93_01800 [Thiothrix sp.]